MGIYKDLTEAVDVRNSMYDLYLTSFLLRYSMDRSVSESHARGHWLLINQLLRAGAVTETGPENRRIFVVKDDDLFWRVSRDLLAELQRIKAVRDEAGLRRLLAEDGPLLIPMGSAVLSQRSVVVVSPARTNAIPSLVSPPYLPLQCRPDPCLSRHFRAILH